MTYNTTLTSKGQVTIPADIRRSMGLKAGETVRFRLAQNNQIVLEKNDWKKGFTQLHQEVSDHLRANHIKPLSDEDLDRAINSSAKQETQEDYERNLKR
jgi:AbrB family looped-hinge helix DNA binding protein